MAPRDLKAEAFQAGQENPYIGDIGPLQRLYGTLGAIGEELGGSDMGTPVGTKFMGRLRQTKADIKRLQELRAKHPEEFGRGQTMAQQAADPYELGLGLGTLGMMTPYGRTTFDMAGRGESPEGIFRNPELGYAPRPPRGRGPGPEGPTINAGFDVPRGMNRFEANQYYMTHGIPGEDIYYRSNPAMPLSTSRNAFEEASVLAANRTRPSPAPANYDYMGPSAPGSVTQRPMSQFDRDSMAAYYRNTGGGKYGPYVPGQRTGPGAVPLDYTLDELGQAVGPAMGREMMPQRGRLPMMARGGEIPYGEFRDVTGNVLRGPEGRGAIGYNPGAMMGQRMGQGAYQYEPVAALPRGGFPYGEAALSGGALGVPAGVAMWNYNRPGVSAAPQGGSPQIGPYDFGMMPGAQGMETMQGFRNYGPPMPQGGAVRKGGTQKATGNRKPTPFEQQMNSDINRAIDARLGGQPQQGQFEGNFNYDVTRAIDALLGGNQAEAGRQYQEYYANNPWPY